jgi:hypothetical protein
MIKMYLYFVITFIERFSWSATLWIYLRNWKKIHPYPLRNTKNLALFVYNNLSVYTSHVIPKILPWDWVIFIECFNAKLIYFRFVFLSIIPQSHTSTLIFVVCFLVKQYRSPSYLQCLLRITSYFFQAAHSVVTSCSLKCVPKPSGLQWPWRRRQQAPPKCLYLPSKLHGVTNQNTTT